MLPHTPTVVLYLREISWNNIHNSVLRFPGPIEWEQIAHHIKVPESGSIWLLTVSIGLISRFHWNMFVLRNETSWQTYGPDLLIRHSLYVQKTQWSIQNLWHKHNFRTNTFSGICTYLHVYYLHSWAHLQERHFGHGKWHPGHVSSRQSHKSFSNVIITPFSS